MSIKQQLRIGNQIQNHAGKPLMSEAQAGGVCTATKLQKRVPQPQQAMGQLGPPHGATACLSAISGTLNQRPGIPGRASSPWPGPCMPHTEPAGRSRHQSGCSHLCTGQQGQQSALVCHGLIQGPPSGLQPGWQPAPGAGWLPCLPTQAASWRPCLAPAGQQLPPDLRWMLFRPKPAPAVPALHTTEAYRQRKGSVGRAKQPVTSPVCCMADRMLAEMNAGRAQQEHRQPAIRRWQDLLLMTSTSLRKSWSRHGQPSNPSHLLPPPDLCLMPPSPYSILYPASPGLSAHLPPASQHPTECRPARLPACTGARCSPARPSAGCHWAAAGPPPAAWRTAGARCVRPSHSRRYICTPGAVTGEGVPVTRPCPTTRGPVAAEPAVACSVHAAGRLGLGSACTEATCAAVPAAQHALVHVRMGPDTQTHPAQVLVRMLQALQSVQEGRLSRQQPP